MGEGQCASDNVQVITVVPTVVAVKERVARGQVLRLADGTRPKQPLSARGSALPSHRAQLLKRFTLAFKTQSVLPPPHVRWHHEPPQSHDRTQHNLWNERTRGEGVSIHSASLEDGVATYEHARQGRQEPPASSDSKQQRTSSRANQAEADRKAHDGAFQRGRHACGHGGQHFGRHRPVSGSGRGSQRFALKSAGRGHAYPRQNPTRTIATASTGTLWMPQMSAAHALVRTKTRSTNLRSLSRRSRT